VLTPLQEIGWFDRDENASGKLAARMATDATHVRGAVGDVFGLLLQNLVMLACGFLIAYIYDWRMALVVTGAVMGER
jgi:ATP-binding cassette subfamily B (MDR/TAP) protein 1